MIQIALVVVSIALIVIGIKGFTKGGLQLSRTTTLTGTSGKIAGTICILLGLVVDSDIHRFHCDVLILK